MTTGMPELGSKISLISKADIRYEGRLFTVDPQECTIALASVRSFGTEDRETQYPVPAQNQVYDYILFRGSDIKDIRVVNSVTHPHPQPLNDPAIMQLSAPPTLGGQPFQTHPILGPMGPQIGQFASAYSNIGLLGGMNAGMGPGLGIQRDARGLGGGKPSELIIPGPEPTSSVLSPTVEPPRRTNDHASVLDLIGGSRSTTPASLGSRKSPTADQGVQAGGSKRDDKKVVKPIQPPGQRNQQRRVSRERRDSRDGVQNQNRSGPNRNQNNQASYQGQGYQGYQGNQNSQGNQRGGNWSNNRGPARPRGRSRGGGGGGGYRSNQNQQNQGSGKPKNTLKFENDYDFEQANTEFEELRSQLGKVKLDEAGSSSTKSEINGDVDKKDDSGNETGAGETEQEEEHEVYYDKSKSFFDKISCEAVERAKGKSQRTDWRVERKLNSETFGVAATRRGNYRGRGGFRGMNYRGGYRGNYRPPQRRDQQQQQGNRSDQNQRQQTTQNSSSNTSNQASIPAQSNASSSSKPASQSTQSNAKKEKNPEPVMAVK